MKVNVAFAMEVAITVDDLSANGDLPAHYTRSDIQKNELILSQLTQHKDYYYFRYLFLSEANTKENRATIRQFLFKNGYKISPVTVDLFEYEWNDP
ncbi:MAG: hypothetical protein KIT56_09875 [Gammaproteobacteria bacterium]|nr:hypothetical protein [Gammaproteobacteria bacterium]MCW5584158.1 hypothetical protein [Gammaproteobacteria bacterium]